MRIIQRCLLAIAFTGVFLCRAQDSSSTGAVVPEFSKSNELTSESAPESSSVRVDEFFTTEKELVSTSEDSSSKTESHTNVTDVTSVKAYVTENHVLEEKTAEKSDSLEDDSFILTGASAKNNSEGVIKEEIHDAAAEDVFTNEIIKTASTELANLNVSGQSKELVKSVSPNNVQDAKYEPPDSEGETLKKVNDKKVLESSSVPFTEELIYEISSIDKLYEDCDSTPISRVQTIESTETDSKSSTQKRSLKTTISTKKSSEADDLILAVEITTSSHQPELFTNTGTDSFENILSTKTFVDSNGTHESHSQGATSFSPNPSTDQIFSHSIDKYENISEAEKVENTSFSHLEVEHLPTSSVALSTPNEESIHFSESFSSMEAASHLDHSISSIPYNSELEVEDNLENRESLVTFDPNGMTNNYTQDPDSVTFITKFHVDGKQTDGYLSRLESIDHLNNSDTSEKEINSLDDTEHITGVFSSNFSDLGGSNASERERELVSGDDLLPHDEPDREELSEKISANRTPKPENFQTSKSYVNIEDNESEEMLNDAPAFVLTKSTFVSAKNDVTTARDSTIDLVKYIPTTPSSIPKTIDESIREFEISVEYNSQQSEVRPVTVASPLQTAEYIDDLHQKAENLSSSFTITSEHPETTLPHTSSPIIQPNPAPTAPGIVGQGQDGTTRVLVPDFEVGSTITETKYHNSSSTDTIDKKPISNSTTISEVGDKTSVSESLPLSKVISIIAENQTTDVITDTSESASPFPVSINGADSNSSTNEPTPVPTVSTTVSRGLRIRKPKIKIGGTEEPETPQTRKPFLSPPQRSSTTEGPPVSIFKKSRTRVASITSSTTARPFPQFSTLRVHYASRIPGMVPKGEFVYSVEPISTTVATTTETEEPFSIEPFTEVTQVPVVTNEDDVTLVKVAGYIVVVKGLRWNDQLDNRHSPQYKEKANFVHLQLERFFRTSSIAPHLWKIQIDGFSGKRNSHSVAVDFFIYLIKSKHEIPAESLTTVFQEKLTNNTFSRFRVDPSQTSFEFVTEEPLKAPTPPPENSEEEPVIPQWAIAVIVVGAASLIFVILFALVAILGRRHMQRRYSNKLNDEDSDRPTEWESKMAAAYENLAADTIYDVEDLNSDTYKKSMRPNSTYHGRFRYMTSSASPRPRRADSWSSSDWSPPPRRPRPQVHRIVY